MGFSLTRSRLRLWQLRNWLGAGVLWLWCAAAIDGWAGGSGLNTVVIANQSSSDSLELANYFCEVRKIPPENVLRINWAGGNISWTSSDFQTYLLNPLLAMLAARQLTNQVYYVVLSMAIPFQTINANGITYNGTTSALFYGLKPVGNNWTGTSSSYAASEKIFQYAQPASAPGYSFLACMITADSLDHAKQIVDRGVTSDGTFPTSPVMLEKSPDPARNIRWTAFDNAIFNAQILGNSSILRTNSDLIGCQTQCLGFETGLPSFSVPPGAFVPGAMADSLTSAGGVIFGPNDQTSLLAFINAGACGSYGTVSEPSADAQKFPDPQVYFYQSRGFSLAESYYQSINAPFLGLVVGEPLAAPFAQLASGKWQGTNGNRVLSGVSNLSLAFPARGVPLQQIDLFVDGKYFQTVTNLAPRAGNLLKVALNGYPVTYAVLANSTLATVTTGLVAALNAPAVTNATKVRAFAHGDRIELQSISTNRLTDPFFFSDGAATNSPGRSYRITYLPLPVSPQLTLLGLNRNGNSALHIEMPTAMPYVLLASTDLVNWLPIFTNSLGSSLDFSDLVSPNYSKRFYRLLGVFPEQRPKLSALGPANGGGFKVHADTPTSLPYVLQFATNLTDWTSLSTNLLGGPADFIDPQAALSSLRLYRAKLLPQSPAPAVGIINSTADGALLRVDGALRPYRIEVSTNGEQWTSLAINLGPGKIQLAVNSSIGSADLLSTFLTASRPSFLNSTAYGYRQFLVDGAPQIGDWLQLNITRANGSLVAIGITNQSSGASTTDVASQLAALINSTPALQGTDGVVAEDVGTDSFARGTFNLRARSAGYEAAAIQALIRRSANLIVTPPYLTALKQNASDLQPRNHLYISAGAGSLNPTFPLDTALLADGFHELSAVAYEGSHVHTQTRTVLPVLIQNSSLTATLALDMAATNSVQGTYHISVAANTNNVSTISLFTTGGLWNSVTNQSATTFSVDGPALGVGRHGFYAVVETATGQKYRTETQSVRLVSGP